jgi:hypothetical protein
VRIVYTLATDKDLMTCEEACGKLKSYFLEGMGEVGQVRSELSNLLPDQADPWLLYAAEGDAVAYFNIIADEPGAFHIQADLSGRHYNRDDAALNVLRELQRRLGGVVRNDDGNQLG